jgi:hypothetical protein
MQPGDGMIAGVDSISTRSAWNKVDGVDTPPEVCAKLLHPDLDSCHSPCLVETMSSLQFKCRDQL